MNNNQGFNQEMEDLVNKFAGGPQAQKYFTGMESETKKPRSKIRSISKGKKTDIDKLS